MGSLLSKHRPARRHRAGCKARSETGESRSSVAGAPSIKGTVTSEGSRLNLIIVTWEISNLSIEFSGSGDPLTWRSEGIGQTSLAAKPPVPARSARRRTSRASRSSLRTHTRSLSGPHPTGSSPPRWRPRPNRSSDRLERPAHARGEVVQACGAIIRTHPGRSPAFVDGRRELQGPDARDRIGDRQWGIGILQRRGDVLPAVRNRRGRLRRNPARDDSREDPR